MRVLITGAAGFIGYHLAKLFLQDGAHVTGLDSMHRYYSQDLKTYRMNKLREHPRYKHVFCDVASFGDVADAIRHASPNIIYHLAGQAGVRHSIERPDSYIRSNVMGSVNILEVAKKLPVKHIVMASSSSVYGDYQRPAGISETTGDTDHPLSVYAASKKSMELMAHSYAHQFQMPITICRFFTVWGPLGRPDMALHRIIEAILAEQAIEITGDGNQRRDFTHVYDVADALMRLHEFVPGEPVPGDILADDVVPYRVLNIARGQPISVNDLVAMVERVLHKSAAVRFVPASSADPKDTYGNSDALARLTGMRAGYNVCESNIEVVVKHGIEAGLFPSYALKRHDGPPVKEIYPVHK